MPPGPAPGPMTPRDLPDPSGLPGFRVSQPPPRPRPAGAAGMPQKINPYIYRTTSLSLSLSLSPRASVYIEGSKFFPFIYRAKKNGAKTAGRGRGRPRAPAAAGAGRPGTAARTGAPACASRRGRNSDPSRAGARNGPASRRRQGSPPVKRTSPPLCRPSGPADLPDVPIRPEGGKKPVRGSESKAGISREGPASRRPGMAPRAKHPCGETHSQSPAPLCRPGGPADLPDVPITARRTAESLYAALRAKDSGSHDPGRDRSPGRGAPRQNTSCERAPAAARTDSRTVPAGPSGRREDRAGSTPDPAGLKGARPHPRKPRIQPARGQRLIAAPFSFCRAERARRR